MKKPIKLPYIKLPLTIISSFYQTANNYYNTLYNKLYENIDNKDLVKEYILLIKYQTFLLKVQKDCRCILHLISQEIIKICLWISITYYKHSFEEKYKFNKSVVDKIRAKTVNSVKFPYSINIISNPIGNNLNNKELTNLKCIVPIKILNDFCALITNPNKLYHIVGAKIRNKHQFKVNTNYEIQQYFKDVVDNPKKLTELLKSINELLHDFNNYSNYWINFWSEIAEIINQDLTARKVQLEWIKNFHPNNFNTKTYSDQAVLDLLVKNNNNFKLVSEYTNLTVFQVFSIYKRSDQSTSNEWSIEEEKIFNDIYYGNYSNKYTYIYHSDKIYKSNLHKLIETLVQALPNKSIKNIQDKIKKSNSINKKTTSKSGNWKVTDDVVLMYLVLICGIGKWNDMVQLNMLPNKNDAQLRDRFLYKKKDWWNKATMKPDDKSDCFLRLMSSDNVLFELSINAAKGSNHLTTIIEDCDVNEVIPLQTINANILEKVIEYLNHTQNTKQRELPKPLPSKPFKELVTVWEYKFVNLELPIIFELILAANYMDITGLIELCSAKIASEIRGRSVEEIRAIFNIENDFTPDEEKQIKDENRWCEGL